MFSQLNIALDIIIILVLIAVIYQCVRTPNLRRLIGLFLMFIVVILYVVGIIFFPRSPLIPSRLPPLGLLWCIYYLTYPEKRNRILVVITIILIILLFTTYFISLINP